MSSVAVAPTAGSAPQPASLTLAIHDSASTFVLRIAGPLELSGIGRVMAALDGLDEAHTTQLILDLRDVTFLDLAGLKTILRANDHCRDHNIAMTVVKPRGLARRVFTLTRVHLELHLVDFVAPDLA